MYAYIYTCMYACMYACMYVCIHRHALWFCNMLLLSNAAYDTIIKISQYHETVILWIYKYCGKFKLRHNVDYGYQM